MLFECSDSQKNFLSPSLHTDITGDLIVIEPDELSQEEENEVEQQQVIAGDFDTIQSYAQQPAKDMQLEEQVAIVQNADSAVQSEQNKDLYLLNLRVLPKRRAHSSAQVDAVRFNDGDLLLINEDDGDELEQSAKKNSSFDGAVSEYSVQSFEMENLDEGAVNDINWCDIEEANRNGVSRASFPLRHAREIHVQRVV